MSPVRNEVELHADNNGNENWEVPLYFLKKEIIFSSIIFLRKQQINSIKPPYKQLRPLIVNNMLYDSKN